MAQEQEAEVDTDSDERICKKPKTSLVTDDSDSLDNKMNDAVARVLLLDEMLEKILNFLPIVCLRQCERVCQRWRSIVERLLKCRQQIHWFTYVDGDCQEQLNDRMKELRSQPKTMMIFCSDDLSQFSHPPSGGSQKTKKPSSQQFIDFLCQRLPPDCDVVGCKTPGVVGMSSDDKHTVEYEEQPAATCLILPKLETLEIFSTALQSRFGSTDWSDERLDEVTKVPPDRSIKLFLFFTCHRMMAGELAMITALRRRHRNVVVAGAVASKMIFNGKLPDVCRRAVERQKLVAWGYFSADQASGRRRLSYGDRTVHRLQ